MRRIVALFTLFLITTLTLQAIEQPPLKGGRDAGTSLIGFVVRASSQTAPEESLKTIETNLDDVLGHEGLRYRSGNCFLEITINEVSQYKVGTSPSQIQLRLDVIVRAIDRDSGKVLGTRTLIASGMDTTLDRAYMKAVRMVNFRTGDFMGFLDDCKQILKKEYPGTYLQAGVKPPPLPTLEEMAAAGLIRPLDIPPPAPIVPDGFKLANGIYVEYVNILYGYTATDVVLKVTNYNDNSEVINFADNIHIVYDIQAKNIGNMSTTNLDGTPLRKFILKGGESRTFKVSYRGEVTPLMLYLHEASRDYKVRIICN